MDSSTSHIPGLKSILFSDLCALELYKARDSQGHHIQSVAYTLRKSKKRLKSKWCPQGLFSAQPTQLFTVVLSTFLMTNWASLGSAVFSTIWPVLRPTFQSLTFKRIRDPLSSHPSSTSRVLISSYKNIQQQRDAARTPLTKHLNPNQCPCKITSSPCESLPSLQMLK